MARKKRRWLWIILIVVIVCVVAFIAMKGKGENKNQGPKTVKVEKRNIVDKALAVGKIEPENEVQVKSKVTGVVTKLFADISDFVTEGTPLIEIKPDPTPQELVAAKREIELKEIELTNLKREINRKKELKEKGLISDQEFEDSNQRFDEVELGVKMAKERLQLLEKGKVKIANTNIESVVKSPITGYILERNVALGDPVVPLTSYQPGTVLLVMANMENLLFKGTVDEIDVGKIKEGMSVDIQVGALPGKSLKGKVTKISLKAQKEDNSTVFPIEIMITNVDNLVLRAGYSANANIIIQQKDSVLTVPERLVTFRNDSAFVKLPQEDGTQKEVFIKTGLSDAIYIEVQSGLEEGQEVLEKEVKEII